MKVPATQTVTMTFFKLAKKIRAPRYLIATSLMINSNSIFSTFIIRFGNYFNEIYLLDTHTSLYAAFEESWCVKHCSL